MYEMAYRNPLSWNMRVPPGPRRKLKKLLPKEWYVDLAIGEPHCTLTSYIDSDPIEQWSARAPTYFQLHQRKIREKHGPRYVTIFPSCRVALTASGTVRHRLPQPLVTWRSEPHHILRPRRLQIQGRLPAHLHERTSQRSQLRTVDHLWRILTNSPSILKGTHRLGAG